MYTLISYEKSRFYFAFRRKCDIEPRDRDSKSIMEPRDLSSSARLFPNAQIKIRWVDIEITRVGKICGIWRDLTVIMMMMTMMMMIQ